MIEEGDPFLADAIRAAGIAVEAKAGAVPLRRAERGPRAAHPGAGRPRPSPCRRGASRRSSARLPVPPGLRRAAQARLHRGRRHRLLHARRPAAVRGHGHLRRAWAPRSASGSGCATSCPEQDARRVVCVIGDCTFVHSGMTGLVEMVYNPPATGHVAHRARQRHHRHDRPAGAPRHRPHARATSRPARCRSRSSPAPWASRTWTWSTRSPIRRGFEKLLVDRLARPELSVIVARRPCILAAADIRKYEKAAADRVRPPARRREDA